MDGAPGHMQSASVSFTRMSSLPSAFVLGLSANPPFRARPGVDGNDGSNFNDDVILSQASVEASQAVAENPVCRRLRDHAEFVTIWGTGMSQHTRLTHEGRTLWQLPPIDP